MKMILADDEKIIRDSLVSLVDWTSLEIQITDVCSNGIETYESILDHSPDIVLTDIKMPGLNGLELIEKAAALNQSIEFILLSGYSDFEFARQAMRFGVKHYLMKPCDEETLRSVVRETVRDCRKKRYHAALEREARAPGHAEPYLRNILYEFFSGVPVEDIVDSYQARIDFYREPYTALCYCDCTPDMARTLWNGYRAACTDHGQPPLTGAHSGKRLVLFGLTNDLPPYGLQSEQPLAIQFEHLFALLQELGQYFEGAEQLRLFCFGGELSIRNHSAALRQLDICLKEMTQLGDKRKPCSYLSRFAQSVQDMELARALFTYCVTRLTALQSDMQFPMNAYEELHRINQYVSFEEFQQAFERLADCINRASAPTGQHKPFIQTTLDYVRENLDNPNLSLKWISENILFMNVDYVSKQFSRETGCRFSHYLNQMRIERAQQLLLANGEEKIYLVAQQVGCGNNPQYFGQIFKKYTGLTPRDFLRQKYK